MPGPPPKPRPGGSVPGAVFLPAAGRPGPKPKWPLQGAEAPAWAYLWRLPQAVAWEQLHLHRVVARYALVLADVEGGESNAALLAEARQVEDRLGLSAMSLLRLRWQIVDTLPTVATGPKAQGSKSRLRAV